MRILGLLWESERESPQVQWEGWRKNVMRGKGSLVRGGEGCGSSSLWRQGPSVTKHESETDGTYLRVADGLL